MSEDKDIKKAGDAVSPTPETRDDKKTGQVQETAEKKEPVRDPGKKKEASEKNKSGDPGEKKVTGEQKETGDTAEGEGKSIEARGSDGSFDDKPESGEKVVGPAKDESKDTSHGSAGKPSRGSGRDNRGVEKYWVPKTRLGKMVRDGQLTTIEQVLDSGFILREPEIVDILLGEMQDEVIDVNMVQRMTDSGRRVRFAVTVAVGNENGYLGVGRAHGKEVGPTIRKAIDNAKINIISLKRGCGSWECGCGSPHSIPYRTHGKSGSVEVTFLPAPKGVGLAAGDVAKKILKLGGIRDLWATTRGQTQTTWNYASAVYSALINLSKMRVNQRQQEKFRILTGGIEE